MPDLKFNGEVIPVVHLMPDDVLVFAIPRRLESYELRRTWRSLRSQFATPRKVVLMADGTKVEINRDGKPIPVGET